MGIRGLTNLIKRYCPNEIRHVSVNNFRGKRIAIDGNLLMQRFHHGSTSTPILTLWYRFLKGLQDKHDITPICIFDGKNRLPQKQKELAKRTAARHLLKRRADIAQERSDRVDALNLSLSALYALPPDDRRRVVSCLQPLLSRSATDVPKVHDGVDTVADQLNAITLEDTANTPLSLESQLIVDDIKGLIAMSQEDVDEEMSKIQQQHKETEHEILSKALDVNMSEDEIEHVYTSLERLQLDSATVAASYVKRAESLDPAEYEKLEEVIAAMGLPIIKVPDETPHEAEALGANLVLAGYADVVASEDSDVLLYDVLLLRNLTGRVTEPTLLSGKQIRTALGLDRQQFIELGILCGSDFADRIPKLGPLTAYKLVKEHGTIEAIIQADQSSEKPKYTVPDLRDYLEQVVAARSVFYDPPCIPTDPSTLNTRPPSPDLDKVLTKYNLHYAYVPDGEWQPGYVL